MQLKTIQTKDILANFTQPRVKFEKEGIKELAESILSNGLINPITTRKWKNKFMIVAGERRWRAHKVAGLKTIQVFVKDYKKDIDWQVESLVENLMREDLTSIERENNIYALWKTGIFKSHAELGRKIGYKDEYQISDVIHAKQDRERLGIRIPKITTLLLKKTRGIKDEDRKKLLGKVQEGKIIPERIKELAPLIKKAPEEVKEALLSDEINVEQAERISKLKTPQQREKAITEHKSLAMVDKGIERNIENQMSAREKREFDKKLLQAGNWIKSFRGSVTDSYSQLEKTIKILLFATKFILVMDDKQKERLNMDLNRLIEVLQKAEQLSEQIQYNIERG